ncbi:MAG: dienelactone hydrolase family protein [Dehalococcoidia bacterium]|nr:dienelactone hydrolase family protein [Dehalococcoidia bacterium]
MAIHAQMVEFPVNGGTATGYLVAPDSPGTKPGVVVIQEWWGLNDHIKDVARRFAEEGFVAIAPDHYHGRVAEEPTDAMKLAMEIDYDKVVAEVSGAMTTLRNRGDVGKIGVVGFCMGGRITFLTACRNRGVGAAVVFYGRAPAEEELRNIEAPVLALYAEDDPNITPLAPQVSAQMAAAGKNFTYHVYPGTRHGFFNDDRPSTYHPEAAADAWRWTLRFFRQNLA